MEAPRITRPLNVTSIRTQAALPSTMIRAEQIEKKFAEDVGVFDLNFEVPTGTIFGMIGPSGCGKTTTVRLMTGLYKPDSGKLTVMSHTPSKFTPHERERLGYMPQHFVLYPNLTVWENLNFVASLYGMGYFKRRKPLLQALEFVELSDARNRLGSQLSGGMQRRLELACTLVHNPLLIFADEPTAGIDPVLRGKFWNHFRHMRDDGRTLFVTTQYVGEAVYCDMVAVMRAGRIVHMDTPENLRKKALGGDMVRLVVDAPHALEAAQLFQRHPAITDVRRSRSEPGLLYLYTDDASATLPLIFQLMGEHPDITVQQAEKYVPPFDDVFVKLMEQAEEEHV
ncbi:MAG: ABC transporter ATP-binding protein [Chloroflexota bacterium]|nr:ABC transporter ATP-binding protein [Chloroflexota bacterium]